MENERLFYLDFIRAFATVSILLTHFNAIYLYINPPMPEKAVITTTVANIYIGNFGVSLFFIISGAALMYVYQEKCNLKDYFKKKIFINISDVLDGLYNSIYFLCGHGCSYFESGSFVEGDFYNNRF